MMMMSCYESSINHYTQINDEQTLPRRCQSSLVHQFNPKNTIMAKNTTVMLLYVFSPGTI
jgi:hypothetical protein